MERESANPEFAFMFNLQSPEHMYFRWRLYSLAQGARKHLFVVCTDEPATAPAVSFTECDNDPAHTRLQSSTATVCAEARRALLVCPLLCVDLWLDRTG